MATVEAREVEGEEEAAMPAGAEAAVVMGGSTAVVEAAEEARGGKGEGSVAVGEVEG